MSHRTQITLTDKQYSQLMLESARTGLPLAELIRRAVNREYQLPGLDDIRHALDQSFGSWGDRDFDGAGYVESLRPGLGARLDSW